MVLKSLRLSLVLIFALLTINYFLEIHSWWPLWLLYDFVSCEDQQSVATHQKSNLCFFLIAWMIKEI